MRLAASVPTCDRSTRYRTRSIREMGAVNRCWTSARVKGRAAFERGQIQASAAAPNSSVVAPSSTTFRAPPIARIRASRTDASPAAEGNEGEVSDADDRGDQIPRLPQSPQAHAEPIPHRVQREVEERRARHDSTAPGAAPDDAAVSSRPVTCRKICSRLDPASRHSRRRQLGDRAVGDLLPAIDDHDARADLLHQVQQVRRHDDGAAAAAARHDRLAHPPDAEWVEPGQRLVEEQRRRIVQQPARDGDLLLHAARQLARQRVSLRRQLQLLEQRRRAVDSTSRTL